MECLTSFMGEAEVGDALVRHKDIAAVSFTGGTATGAHIASVTAPKFKKLSLELGRKNAAVIFDDCDFDEALEDYCEIFFC